MDRKAEDGKGTQGMTEEQEDFSESEGKHAQRLGVTLSIPAAVGVRGRGGWG